VKIWGLLVFVKQDLDDDESRLLGSKHCFEVASWCTGLIWTRIAKQWNW